MGFLNWLDSIRFRYLDPVSVDPDKPEKVTIDWATALADSQP